MNFPEWHFIKDNEFPENYPENIEYSYKCNEYTLPVLVVTKNYRCYKAIRCRLTTEENFKWWAAKGITKALKFKPEDIICWTFLPTKEYLKNIKKEWLQQKV